MIQKDKNIITLIIAIAIVIINGLIGHFLAPFEIWTTPLVLIITSLLVAFKIKNIRIIWKGVLMFLFACFNDILIKLYAGGVHDEEGYGWITLSLIWGLIPTFFILYRISYLDDKETKRNKVMALTLFSVLVILHFLLFGNLGLGREY